MNFYIARDGQQYGPYPIVSLSEMHEAGQVVDTDLIFPEGAAAWEPVSGYLEKQRAKENPVHFAKPPPLPPSLPPVQPAPTLQPGIGAMTRIGSTNVTVGEVEQEVLAGGRFVIFQYCISVIILTFKRPADIVFLRGHEDGCSHALANSMISLFAGWWGFPWGPIWTIATLVTNASGGKDVTYEMLADLFGTQRAQAIMARRQRPAPTGNGLIIFRWSLIALAILPILLILLLIVFSR